MRGIGYEPGEARILADLVIEAALCGYERMSGRSAR